MPAIKQNRDPVGRLFARLTGELEDAGELAVEGQNRTLPLARRSLLTFRLRKRLGRAVMTVNQIDAAIGQAGEVER